ncbi:MAG: phage integrase SAM-like domain-containing protein [Bacteroidaceae bacterium]|nr:phage integrase SAM-like domain-containing protein [Bacteroidaceae bacterium]
MRQFFIRTNKNSGTAPLYTRIQQRTTGTNILLNTSIEVDIQKWNKAGGNLSAYSRLDGKSVERVAQSVDAAIDAVISVPDFTKEDIKAAVDAVIYKDVREAQAVQAEAQRREHERLEGLRLIEVARENADVKAYLHNLIEGMKNGSVRIEGKGRNKGERYTPNTIKMWQNLVGIIEEFYKVYPFTWESIDKRFATRFRTWMEERGYMAKSVNKYVGQFVALINRALADGKHDNQAAAGYFVKPSVDEGRKAAEIYLTADELNALYELPLEGEKSIVRDIFIIGCCTCQRVSDYSRLKKENFVTTARGAKVVKIQQQKTKNFVTIPILDDKLTAIMEKYDYILPQLPSNFDVILNRYIKEICKELSESVPSLSEKRPTILTMKEREKEARGEVSFERDKEGRAVKPRYELISSHTARRTGITNLYLTGKFDVYQMMHVSGHKEAKTFREYIKLSGDEIAEGIIERMGNDNLF